MYFDSHIKSECCACGACVHSCPKQCISFIEDEEGFRYPKIDESSCIACELCRRVCPFEHPKYENDNYPKFYASMLKNVDERQRSSSGGMFYAIAKWVLAKGGVVFGACLDKNLQVKHIEVKDEANLDKLRGSKYVQSDLGDIFVRIKRYLTESRWVYFTGTGCQVAGLLSFLRKHYDTLVTSDLICHGVPSQRLFDMHVDYLKNKYKGEIEDYKFRDFSSGTTRETFLVIKEGGSSRKIQNIFQACPYLYSFEYSYTCRPACYECRFSRIPRQGDLTLGDYWGIQDFFPDMDNKNGVSLILINTVQGQLIWNDIKNTCEYHESNVLDAAKNNRNLLHKTIKPELRDSIYQEINSEGYKKIASKRFTPKGLFYLKVKDKLYQTKAIRKIIYEVKNYLRRI